MKKPKSLGSLLTKGASFVLFIPLVFMLVPFASPRLMAGQCAGASDILERVQKCPALREKLGDNVHFPWVGFAKVTCEQRGSSATSDMAVPIRGSKASGRLRLAYSRQGGSTSYSYTVDVAGTSIGAETCE